MRLGLAFLSTYQVHRRRLASSAQRLKLEWPIRAPGRPEAPTNKRASGDASAPVAVTAAAAGNPASGSEPCSADARAEEAVARQNSGAQDLVVDLDYRPSLSTIQEVFCVLAALTIAGGLYWAVLAPGRGHGLLAACGALLAAVALRWILRGALLERMFKARELAHELLGDPDSAFRAINNLVVHVKCKVGSALGGALGQQQQQAPPPGSPGVAAAAAAAPLCALHCYHGFGANLGSFMLVQGRLAERLCGVVTAHDMPGFGLTQRPLDMASYFLNFNGRLGRMVLDYELQRLGMLEPQQPAASAASTAVGQPPRVVKVPSQPDFGIASKLGAGPAGSSSGSSSRSGSSSDLTVTLTGGPPGAAAAGAEPAAPTDASAAAGINASTSSAQAAAAPPPAAARPAAAPQPVKRILLGHSLGGACAALEAVSDPTGLSGLVLIAPAILALPGAQYHGVSLGPDRQQASAPADPTGSSSGSAAGRTTQQRMAAARLPAEPLGSHATDPLIVRRLYPVGTFPSASGSGAAAAAAANGGGDPTALQRLMRVVVPLLRAGALMAVLATLRFLAPVITILLRVLVRSRAFWQKGLQQAYYNPGLVSPQLVDVYRLPQLVRGWEAGMVNFLLARLVTQEPAAAATAQTSSSNRSSRGGGGGASGPRGAAAAPGPQPRSTERQPSADGGASAADEAANAAANAERRAVAAVGVDLAAQLARLVTERRLPVLIIHGEQDRLVPASNSQRLARMLPGCEVVLLDRCGHMPQEEVPELFCDLVCEFVDRVEPVWRRSSSSNTAQKQQ